MENWKPISCAPEGVFVHTKIDDERGERNKCLLKRIGRLWFEACGMYMYYTPTHWREMSQVERDIENKKLELKALENLRQAQTTY